MAEKSSMSRFRNFATIVYPESAPSDWKSRLSQFCIPCFVSPLHDQDTNPTGEPKKPHYHVLLTFEGKKSLDQVDEIVKAIGGVGHEVVSSLRGYARYLCHLDNPEKHQYDVDDVESFGGADYVASIGLPTDKYKAIREMMEVCKQNDIISYAELLEYAAEYRPDWFRVLCDSATVVMKEYLKSRTWDKDRQYLTGFNSKSAEGVISETLDYISASADKISERV